MGTVYWAPLLHEGSWAPNNMIIEILIWPLLTLQHDFCEFLIENI